MVFYDIGHHVSYTVMYFTSTLASVYIIPAKYMYLEKRRIKNKISTFLVFPRNVRNKMKNVKCAKFYPSGIHFFIEVTLKRKTGIYLDAREHTLSLVLPHIMAVCMFCPSVSMRTLLGWPILCAVRRSPGN